MDAFTILKVRYLYSDGGVIWSGKPGGSDIGGTWAIVATDENDSFLYSDSGFINLPDRQTTNNHTEFYAAVKALESVGVGWNGTFRCDSKITLGRLFNGDNTKNLPNHWITWAKDVMEQLGVVKPEHIDGHATKAQLAANKGKHGNPVSKWNVECDRLCNLAKEPYAMKKK